MGVLVHQSQRVGSHSQEFFYSACHFCANERFELVVKFQYSLNFSEVFFDYELLGIFVLSKELVRWICYIHIAIHGVSGKHLLLGSVSISGDEVLFENVSRGLLQFNPAHVLFIAVGAGEFLL
jgi:hypothetical protein